MSELNETSRLTFLRNYISREASVSLWLPLRLSSRIDRVSVCEQRLMMPEETRSVTTSSGDLSAGRQGVDLSLCAMRLSLCLSGNCHTSPGPSSSAVVQRLQGISHFSPPNGFL